jgi:hypothetical protein
MSLSQTVKFGHVPASTGTYPGERPGISRDHLAGAARHDWEESIFINGDLKGSRKHLARVLLEEFCRGKCWCFPGDQRLARQCGVGTATIARCLRDLAEFGVVRIIHASGRRWIVFSSHPQARTFLAGLGVAMPADHPVGPADRSVGPADQNDQRSVVVKPRIETPVAPPRPNESTTPDPGPPPFFDWRRIAAEQFGAPVPPPPVAPPPFHPTPAPMTAMERDEILTAVLTTPETVQDCAGATDGPPVDPAPHPAPRSQGKPIPARHADAAVATLEALAKLGSGATKHEITIAMLRLTSLFGDPRSRAFYWSICNDVACNRLLARWLIAAVEEARRPGVRNPAAVFVTHVKRCRAAAGRAATRAGPPGSPGSVPHKTDSAGR